MEQSHIIGNEKSTKSFVSQHRLTIAAAVALALILFAFVGRLAFGLPRETAGMIANVALLGYFFFIVIELLRTKRYGAAIAGVVLIVLYATIIFF